MASRIIKAEGYTIVKATGTLDGHSSESKALLDSLQTPVSDFESHVAIDLSAVDYVNSTMLGFFVEFLASCQEGGFRVVILSPPPSVRNVLEMTGLSVVLPVAETKAEVTAILGSESRLAATDDIDYESLTNEIEALIAQGGKADKKDGGQLNRIIGEKDEA